MQLVASQRAVHICLRNENGLDGEMDCQFVICFALTFVTFLCSLFLLLATYIIISLEHVL